MNINEIKIYTQKRKLASGLVTYYYGKYKEHETGVWKPKYCSVTCDTKAAARLWFRDWLVEYEKSGVAAVVPPEPVKTIRGLFDWWKAYMAEIGISPEIQSCYPQLVTSYVLAHSIADMALEDIEAPKVEDWMRWLKVQPSEKTGEPLAPLTVNKVVYAVRMLVDDAIRRSCDTKVSKNMLNPFRREMVKVVMPKAKRFHGNTNIFLTSAALAALVTCKEVPFWLAVRLVIAWATGARENEQSGWLWKDWRKEGEVTYLRIERQLKAAAFGREKPEYGPPKRDSYRDVPLHPNAEKVLQWWHDFGWSIFVGRQPTAEDPIFPVSKGYRRRRIGMELRQAGAPGHWLQLPEKLREHLKKAGQSDKYDGRIPFTFRSLRASFVTHLELAGTIKSRRDNLMGHAGDTVQDRHYVGRHLPEYYAEVCKIPIPEVTLSVVSDKELEQAAE